MNVVDRFYRRTGLHYAAEWGSTSVCELLLKSGANIFAKDKDGNQPLHCAARSRHAAVCELLMAHGADVDINAVNKHGQTPLHTAAGGKKDCPELCEILLKHDTKIDAVDEGGNQPLHLACKRNHVETANLFVSYGADVSAVNSNGHSPLYLLSKSARYSKDGVNSKEEPILHIAARHGMVATVLLLVNCGADSKAVNTNGQTPLHTAADGENDCPELCELLLKHDAKIDAVDEGGNQPLHLACKHDHSETVKLMVSHGADVDAVNKHGQTPLHTTAGGKKDCPELCEVLLKHDAKIDEVDEDRNQPLHIACDSGLTSTVGALLDSNVDVSAINNDGQTSLHKAACGQRDCPEICLLLIGKGAEVNAVDNSGNTPLQAALQDSKLKMAEVLLANGSDCKVVNGCGETLLHSVCKGGGIDRHELCEELISRGASPHLADREGDLPLHVALKNRLSKTSCLLVKQLDISTLDDLQKMKIQNTDINHLLCFAVNSCDVEGCQKLLDLGANPNELSNFNLLPNLALFGAARLHPLHIAVAKNHSELCHLLLDHGATVNVQMQTLSRNSILNHAQPLHLAVQLGFADVCHLLIEHGANINAETEKGKSLLYLAIVENNNELIRLLLSYGATLDNVKIGGIPVLERSATKGSRGTATLLQSSGE